MKPIFTKERLCPKCKDCYMGDAYHYYHAGYKGLRCPNCGFNIMDTDSEELIERRVDARKYVDKPKDIWANRVEDKNIFKGEEV